MPARLKIMTAESVLVRTTVPTKFCGEQGSFSFILSPSGLAVSLGANGEAGSKINVV
jgi:hypothetical protein